MKVAVLTCAHRGDDARIVHRQARSLLEAGHDVILVAPQPDDPTADPPGLRRILVPRAIGWRRAAAWRGVVAADRLIAPETEIVIVHDPELVPLLAFRRRGRPVVWDVHEDYVASVAGRRYIPDLLRAPVRTVVRAIQRVARRRLHLMLAENAYVVSLGEAPVVPNSTWVPPAPVPYDPEPRPRVVYVGRISRGRGAEAMLELGRRLRCEIDLVLVGQADREIESLLVESARRGDIIWHGPLPNPVALERVAGAACGLSLLHDEPNYRHSRPTKLIEYMAQGVPIVTTPLPLASQLVEASAGGEVVAYGDVDAAEAAIRRLCLADVRALTGAAGHAYVLAHHNWNLDGRGFVELISSWAPQGVPARDHASGLVGNDVMAGSSVRTVALPDRSIERKARERTYHDLRFASDPRLETSRFYAVDRGKHRYQETVAALGGEGTRALEYGCGTGSLAWPLTRMGTTVTGIDLSRVAVAKAKYRLNRRTRVEHSSIRPSFVQMDAEELAFADDSFDLVCGSAILHHLDLERSFAEVARVLDPGGRAVFLEPLGHNPAINAYRRLTPRFRSEDEHPLRVDDLWTARRYFRDVTVEHFDLLALAGVPFQRWSFGERVLDGLHRADTGLFRRSIMARRWAWMVLIRLGAPVEPRRSSDSTSLR